MGLQTDTIYYICVVYFIQGIPSTFNVMYTLYLVCYMLYTLHTQNATGSFLTNIYGWNAPKSSCEQILVKGWPYWHCASFWSLEHFYEWLIMFTWVPCRCSKGFHFFAESEPRRRVAAAIVVAGRISELCRNFHCYTPGFYVIQWSIHPAFIRLQCYTVKYISGFSPVTVLL